MSHSDIIPKHTAIRNYLSQHRLPLYFSKPVMAHIETYMVAATAKGFRVKIVDLAEYSDCYRTTLGHFLAEGKWDKACCNTRLKRTLWLRLQISPSVPPRRYLSFMTIRLLRRPSLRHNKIGNPWFCCALPEQAFGEPRALREFLCTDVSLETETISAYYTKRWPIEIFFRQSKNNLGLDTYQVRSPKAFIRLWTLLAWTHLYCRVGLGQPCPFGKEHAPCECKFSKTDSVMFTSMPKRKFRFMRFVSDSILLNCY